MNSTGFANVKRRVIYRNAKTGAFFVKTAEGLKKYSPTARFRMTNNGKAMRITMNTRNNVPNKIRPARVRISADDAKKRAQLQKNRKNVKGALALIKRQNIGIKPSTRQIRSNFGTMRNLILSPGGSTIFKGKAAATRALKKRKGNVKPKPKSKVKTNSAMIM